MIYWINRAGLLLFVAIGGMEAFLAQWSPWWLSIPCTALVVFCAWWTGLSYGKMLGRKGGLK